LDQSLREETIMTDKDRRPTPPPIDEDPHVPERLPAGGSAGLERLREAEHIEGNAPAREGAEEKRD
jgi:hypothetical protein